MEKQVKYYVVTAIDVEHPNANNDWLYISTKPAYGNMEKETDDLTQQLEVDG